MRRGRFPDLDRPAAGAALDPQPPHRPQPPLRDPAVRARAPQAARRGSTDATLNDVFLAIVGGGLRRFLSELGELPDAPLVAFLPVNVRPKGDEGGGNAVGAILATLATDIDDPGRAAAADHRVDAQREGAAGGDDAGGDPRLQRLPARARRPAGARRAGRHPRAAAARASTCASPTCPARASRCTCAAAGWRPTTRRRSRSTGWRSTSPCSATPARSNVGFIGDRDALPHLQRLAVYTGEALAELDRAMLDVTSARVSATT